MSSETISPTAHYTGYAWLAHGLSDPAFATSTGRRMYRALRAANLAAHALRLPTLDGLLVARHRLIDLRLQQAIDAGEISQVVEIACGLSPRGWRFGKRYGAAVTYVEADLPGMLANKRAILAKLGGETAHHRTHEIDALADSGPTSIAAICGSLDPARGTAIITEGLLNYFAREHVTGMWQRFARALAPFPSALYLSDLILRDPKRSLFEKGFTQLLARFVKGGVHVDFTSADDAETELAAAGLDAVVLDPRDFAYELPGLDRPSAGRVRVIEALPRSTAS